MPEADLTLLVAAATKAGKIAMRYFRKDPQTWDKGHGQGPVTVADKEIDTMLRTELRRARPKYGWLSEETEDNTARLDHRDIFIVDPIDGTRAFIDGQTSFAQSLAISSAGRIKAAVVHLPAKNLTYTARAGAGAWLNGQPILNNRANQLAGARVLAAKSQLNPDLWAGGPPPIERHFRPSLAYRLCLVADGQFDGMFTMRDTWEWDIAAGDLICQEAGAQVTTRHGSPTLYNNPHPQLPGLLATAPALSKSLLAHATGKIC